MNQINILPAKKTDWAIIRTLNQQVFDNDAANDPYLIVDWPQRPEAQTYYQEICQNPDKHHTLIAYLNDTPIGYLTASKKELDYRTNNILEINNMGVDPKYRSQGVGKKLVDALKIWGKQNSFTHLYVNAYFHNHAAQAFYKKMGLKPIDTSFEGEL